MNLTLPQNINILITGGLGLTGNNLARTLVNHGYHVYILTKSLRNEANIQDIRKNVGIIEGDIVDFSLIRNAIKNKDIIFHLAGQSSVPISMEHPLFDLDLNCKSTLNILEACRKYNPIAKIIFSGTVREAGPIKSKYADETQREDPTSIFDLHKLTSEKYLKIYYKVYGLATTTLRFSNVFGDVQINTDPNVSAINHFTKKAIIDRKLKVYGDGGPLRDHNYIDNVIDALISAAQCKETNGNHYVLGSGEGNSFFDFLTKLESILENIHGISIEIEKIETPDVVSKTVQGDLIVDYSYFKKDTGWKPRISFEEGLNKTIEFYKYIFLESPSLTPAVLKNWIARSGK